MSEQPKTLGECLGEQGIDANSEHYFIIGQKDGVTDETPPDQRYGISFFAPYEFHIGLIPKAVAFLPPWAQYAIVLGIMSNLAGHLDGPSTNAAGQPVTH